MKKKIAIIYFSGTGNTQFVAELFKNSFFSYETELYRVEDIINNKTVFNIGSLDMLGIGSPSIGFTPSKIIVDFCKKLPSIKNKKVFLFLTCAGPCYLNDTAFFDVKNNLKSKGYVIIYEKAICMPSNIFFKYDDEMLKRVFEAAVSKVKTMAINISNNLYKPRNDFMPYLFRWFFSIAEKIAILTVPLD